MTFERGDLFVYIGNNKSKPAMAFLECDPEEYIYKLVCAKTFNATWCNSEVFLKQWSPVEKAKNKGLGSEELTGSQSCLFPKAKTVKEQWREAYLKKGIIKI